MKSRACFLRHLLCQLRKKIEHQIVCVEPKHIRNTNNMFQLNKYTFTYLKYLLIIIRVTFDGNCIRTCNASARFAHISTLHLKLSAAGRYATPTSLTRISRCSLSHLERPPFLWSLVGVTVISTAIPSKVGKVRCLATFAFVGIVVTLPLRLV